MAKNAFAKSLMVASIAATAIVVFEVFAQPATLATSDFSAFYCSGKLAGAGIDPNLAAPLLACERSIVPALGPVIPGPSAEPVLLFFEFLARVPAALAYALESVLLWAAYLVTALSLSRTFNAAIGPVAAALTYSDFSLNAMLGQPMPFEVAAIALAAAALTAGRPRLAGFIAAATLALPNFGYPVVVALFIWEPRARLSLSLGLAFVAASYFAFGNDARAVEFFTKVVPAQGLAEASNEGQLSSTWLFWMLGMPESAALRWGFAEAAVASLLAIALAGPLARRIGPAALLFVPACGAVALGPYLHSQNLVLAMPLALCLIVRSTGRSRIAAVVSALCLTTPFLVGTTLTVSETFVVATCGILALAIPGARPSRAIGAGGLAVAGMAGMLLLIGVLPTSPLRAAPQVAAYAESGFDLRLAATAHGIAERTSAEHEDRSVRTFAEKVPYWFGLLAPLATATMLLRRRAAPLEAARNRVPA